MTGIDLIIKERERQITEEGFGLTHDHKQGSQALVIAAHCYLLADRPNEPQPKEWPWCSSWWKPKDKTSNLTKAGALYLAAAQLVRFMSPLSREAHVLESMAETCGKLIDKLEGT